MGIETHVTDLADLLWFEDLQGATLGLHSYAGVLAGPVAERAGQRLASIIFPARCQTEQVPYDPAALEALRCSYVWHDAPPLASLGASRQQALASGWVQCEIHCDHDMMLTDPGQTAALIEELSS